VRRDSAFSVSPRRETLDWLLRFAAASRNGNVHRATDSIRSLSVASLELHAELAALGTGFERRGTLSVYETDTRFAAGRDEAARSGLAHRVLTGAEVAEVEPALAGGNAGAVFFPDEAHVDPLRYVEAVGDAAASAGADVQTGVQVRSLRPGAVETSHGSLRPKTTVLAAGAWTAPLALGLGLTVPVTGGKGYHLDFAPLPGDLRVPTLLQEARCALTPLPGRLRIAGLLDIVGRDPRLDRTRVDAVRRAAARALGRDDRDVIDVWAGLRPCAPDGLPVIGRPAALGGVVLATGHAMKGLSLAPVTGRVVAELVGGETPSHDLGPFSPDRFRRAGGG
jgi:D-amino-acid dehydrogenase